MTRRQRRSRAGARQSLPAPVFFALACCVLVLALPLAYGGLRMLSSGIYNYQALSFMAHWRQVAREPAAEAYAIGHRAAQNAARLYPVANGRYLNNLGLVRQWQGFRHPFGDKSVADTRRASLEALREAVAARPTWPAAWVDLAWTKLYLLEFDSEFAHALHQAQTLGPWRIGVNRSLSEIGMISWPSLAEPERALILESARRTLDFSAREANQLMRTAERTGMTATLCAKLPQDLLEKREVCPRSDASDASNG
jgi:hypothetical protein